MRHLAMLTGICAVLACGGSGPPPAPHALSHGQPAQMLNLDMVLGLWHSSFGPVKIERASGGERMVRGAWVYDKDGQEVIGRFWGRVDGNVLQLDWQEPGAQGLQGIGYLTFEADGKAFNGQWWSHDRARTGEWKGWRKDPFVGRRPAPQAAN